MTAPKPIRLLPGIRRPHGLDQVRTCCPGIEFIGTASRPPFRIFASHTKGAGALEPWRNPHVLQDASLQIRARGWPYLAFVRLQMNPTVTSYRRVETVRRVLLLKGTRVVYIPDYPEGKTGCIHTRLP